ncbi:ABC-type antimicrobial peptide transport system permease subunit [Bradyrhizobium sp. LB9.1b]
MIRGVFDGRDRKTDTSQLFFHWDYLNETLRVRSKAQADQVGIFAVEAVSINRVADVSQAIDGVFRNSLAETLTETERAFQIGFMKQTEAILISIRIVSFVVIFIILAVMANTMAMTARERFREYATLKAIGFSPGYVARLILGESVVLALIGGAIAIGAHAPGCRAPCRALRDPLPNTDRKRPHRHISGTCGVGGRGARRGLADAPGSPCQHRQWSSGVGLTMPLLLAYSWRNLHVRKLTNLLTATGMALVVFVYAAVLMLDSGLKQTLVATGEDTNVIFVRRSAEVEIQSLIDRRQARIIESQPEVAIGAEGAPLVSKEVAVLITRPRRNAKQASNVLIRGVGPAALAVRPQLRVAEGRMFRPGSNEIVIGGALAGRFEDVEIGSSLRFAQREWKIVGRFNTGGSGFDSEIWSDSEQLMQSFRRDVFSSVTVRLADRSSFDALKARLEADPRLTIEAKRERIFYEEQSHLLSGFIQVLGMTLSVMFSLGAVIGATITMYAAVASRMMEVGVLRALGFRRSRILVAFLVEALLLALVGWVIGLLFASLMMQVKITTLNWTSLSELAFRFVLTPGIVLRSLVFALVMGFLGGFLPAVQAARMKIVDALRVA